MAILLKTDLYSVDYNIWIVMNHRSLAELLRMLVQRLMFNKIIYACTIYDNTERLPMRRDTYLYLQNFVIELLLSQSPECPHRGSAVHLVTVSADHPTQTPENVFSTSPNAAASTLNGDLSSSFFTPSF